MDTESPVVWPAWCYSGDTSITRESPSEAEAPSTPISKQRRRERAVTTSLTPTGDYHQSSINNNNNITNNNNVKNERLSPGTTDTSSRSVTPSSASHPNTPPAENSILQLTGRNYSDFMRSLAAKYQNASPNEYFARNGFPPGLDSRFKSNFPLLHPSMVQNVKEEMAKNKEFQSSMLLNPFAASSMFPPLLDMSSTQALLAMVRTAKEAELQTLLKNVKRNESSSPLDLSAAAPPTKRARMKTPVPKRAQSESPKPGAASGVPLACTAANAQNGHHHPPAEDISSWGVEDVCAFVGSIDICAEYVQNFKDQRIDGSGLPLLTEDHLTSTMHMKLGPALKLRSVLAKKMGSCSVCLHCTHCHNANTSLSSTSATSPDSNTESSAT